MTSDFAAAEQDLSIDQGDDETIAITRQASDGTAKDISGYTFWLTVKAAKSDADADAKIQKQVTSHTDAANGETEIDIAGSDTSSLQGSYVYDIQEKTSGGDINSLMTGGLYIRQDVTESTS